MGELEAWWSGGERVSLALSGRERSVFRVRRGDGPALTLLHGFPSSSHDWTRVAPALEGRHLLLMPDLLGFGGSEKPADHRYSLHEQADLVQALWRHEGVEATGLVAHDYGVSVAQELLARSREGALGVRLGSVWLLNGGVYPDLHRPQPVQSALLDPEQGPRISALVNRELFLAGLRPTFAERYAGAESDSEVIWRATSREDGHRIGHLLIRYMEDRREHAARWTGALEAAEVQLGFVWGMLDPVSGAHMAERIRARLPRAAFTELRDVAHWPPLEAPQRVAAALLGG